MLEFREPHVRRPRSIPEPQGIPFAEFDAAIAATLRASGNKEWVGAEMEICTRTLVGNTVTASKVKLVRDGEELELEYP